jgi:formylglycine-generating enzyme required for sulfatase activity
VVNTLVPEGPDDVPDPTDRHRRAAILAGEALLDLDLVRHTAGHLDYAALVRRVRRWLRGLIEAGCLAPRERLEAGDILGRLGDPRPGVGVRVVEGREVPDIVWVEIPAGPFLMGSPADEEEASDHEKSQHELHLPRYYIARYPVTNAQFRPFVAGGGYDNPAYWTEQGWTWRNGAEPDLSVYDDFSNEEAVRNYREWLTGRPAEKRDRPFWWGDRRRGAPTRPVVGVTWHEVVAYARWLAARLRDGDTTLSVWAESEISDLRLEPGDLRVWLPSEAEWEKAARGTDGRRYPWGDWEAGRANTEELDLGETNPVGIFPAGRSPYGVQEMAGNVWEWTRSRWGEQSVMWVDYGYPYVPDDGRERLEDMRIPILRGGSWGSSRGHARCAVRSGGGPDGFGSSVGFRVVVSLACSDS